MTQGHYIKIKTYIKEDYDCCVAVRKRLFDSRPCTSSYCDGEMHAEDQCTYNFRKMPSGNVTCSRTCKSHKAKYNQVRDYGLHAAQIDPVMRCHNCGASEDNVVEPPRKKIKICIDHNHALYKGDEGFIRGLLCNNCNLGIGLLDDE